MRLLAYVLASFCATDCADLPKRTDHRDGSVLQSAVAEIEIDFIDGVPPPSILPKVFLPGRRHDKFHRELVPGEPI